MKSPPPHNHYTSGFGTTASAASAHGTTTSTSSFGSSKSTSNSGSHKLGVLKHPVSGQQIPLSVLRTGEKFLKVLTEAGLLDRLALDEDPTTWTLRDVLQMKDPKKAVEKLQFSVFQEVVESAVLFLVVPSRRCWFFP